MSSLRKSQLFFGGFSWVVMRILTGPSSSSILLNSSNIAQSYYSAYSTPASCLSSMVIGFCLSSAGNFFLSFRSFILIWFLKALRLQCTSCRFCLFLIQLGSLLKVQVNSSIDLGRTLIGFFFLLPCSSLWVFLTSFGIVVVQIILKSDWIRRSEGGLMVYKIIIQMEQTFSPKQIIWAKVKGYPWWPAKIVKLPSQQAQVFKVQFIAEDTHAFLNPRDVRKYQEYYDECSKKKMRGLVPAIQTADQLHKKRIQILPIGGGTSIDKLVRPKLSPKKKFIKRVYRKRKQESSHSSSSDNDPSSSSQKVQVQKEEVQVQVQVSIEKQESEDISDQNIEDQKLDVESDQKVDRNKIDIVEDSLLKIVEKIKENEYVFNQQDFLNLQNLSCEELLMGKITNILNFILGKLTLNSSQNNDTRWLKHFRQGLKQKIVDHLYDTTYYDQYIKLIQKNKRSRNEYQGSLIAYLRNQYRIKKELALVFASRLVAQINNGTVSRQKQLLEDIKEHRVDLLNMNNKAAVDRCIEALIPKYM